MVQEGMGGMTYLNREAIREEGKEPGEADRGEVDA
jgi:hypothetical protein